MQSVGHLFGMVLGRSKFPMETKYPGFLPISGFGPIGFLGIPTNPNCYSLSQKTRRHSLPQPPLVPLQKVVHTTLRPPGQFPQFSNRHALVVARKNPLACCI